jgi:DNA-directed RNA polymerase
VSSVKIFKHLKVTVQSEDGPRPLGLVAYDEKFVSTLSKGSYIASGSFLPMVVPPEPWLDFRKGGYLSLPVAFDRVQYKARTQTIVAKACVDGDVDDLFYSLDALGSTAWNINREVFRVVTKAWNDGLMIGKYIPKKYTAEETEFPKLEKTDKTQQEEIRAYAKARFEHIKILRENHALRCTLNYTLNIANKVSIL